MNKVGNKRRRQTLSLIMYRRYESLAMSSSLTKYLDGVMFGTNAVDEYVRRKHTNKLPTCQGETTNITLSVNKKYEIDNECLPRSISAQGKAA